MKDFARIGYVLGASVAVFIVMMLNIPEREEWHSLGTANPGHEDLTCAACHAAADGSFRQQVQANTRAFFGLRDSSVTFGYQNVTNANCLACHDRPNDNHPVFRFNESRFVDARKAIAPQLCESCHLEHQGQRVTIEPTYCVNCHADLTLADDPIEVPHAELIANEDWSSCLRCHDFHGNHIRETPVLMADMLDQAAVDAYLDDGPSPYSTERYFSAKETLDD